MYFFFFQCSSLGRCVCFLSQQTNIQNIYLFISWCLISLLDFCVTTCCRPHTKQWWIVCLQLFCFPHICNTGLSQNVSLQVWLITSFTTTMKNRCIHKFPWALGYIAPFFHFHVSNVACTQDPSCASIISAHNDDSKYTVGEKTIYPCLRYFFDFCHLRRLLPLFYHIFSLL